MYPLLLFVGLGNPGPLYKKTRHNLGFRVIDILSKELGIKLKKDKDGSIGCGKIDDAQIFFAKPNCFMNKSGINVLSIYQRLKPNLFVLIYDDMDIEPGRIKIKKSGESAGHKGVSSVIFHLKTKEFPRIKVGIGKPKDQDPIDYVLGVPGKDERKLLDKGCQLAKNACIMITKESLDRAMSEYNRS
ncbi:TPA: aminoacyl-tRNA hydrolase [bacterium]|nr:aminoacyl-tRNA hydrolase [bacterium]